MTEANRLKMRSAQLDYERTLQPVFIDDGSGTRSYHFTALQVRDAFYAGWAAATPAGNTFLEVARKLYTKETDNDPVMHSNRFPSWDELSAQQQEKYVDRAIAEARENAESRAGEVLASHTFARGLDGAKFDAAFWCATLIVGTEAIAAMLEFASPEQPS